MLFVDSQGFGDVVQSLPLLRAVCQWAEEHMPLWTLFATSDHYQLVREEKLKLTPLFVSSAKSKPLSMLALWAMLVGKLDLIVCPPEVSAAKLIWLKYATGARYAIGEASAPYNRFLASSVETSWTRPWTETQDAIAASLGIKIPLELPAIRLTSQEIQWAESAMVRASADSKRPVFGIQCSSAVPQKSWPPANFAEVVKETCHHFPDICVVSFGNAKERASADNVHRMVGNIRWLEGSGCWTIRQTLAMLSRCDLFLSGDTGLMHMAAAVGTPTISIFGPTSAIRRAPNHRTGIALCPETSCHPCFHGAWRACDCIRSITPARVMASVDQCLTTISNARGHRELVAAAAVETALS